jgi:hypothetical protein
VCVCYCSGLQRLHFIRAEGIKDKRGRSHTHGVGYLKWDLLVLLRRLYKVLLRALSACCAATFYLLCLIDSWQQAREVAHNEFYFFCHPIYSFHHFFQVFATPPYIFATPPYIFATALCSLRSDNLW